MKEIIKFLNFSIDASFSIISLFKTIISVFIFTAGFLTFIGQAVFWVFIPGNNFTFGQMYFFICFVIVIGSIVKFFHEKD